MKKEHILVGVSSAPSNTRIIRAAAQMANAYKGNFTALYVETPDHTVMSKENKQRLEENIRYAQMQGAKVEIVYGDDVPFQIAEFARLSEVTSIVVGRSNMRRRLFPGHMTITERLIQNAPDLDIHIIPDLETEKIYYKNKTVSKWSWRNFGLSILFLTLATVVGLIFLNLGFTEANIIMVYILGVLAISITTTHRMYSLLSSIVSVFLFNFFFTVPRYTFLAYHHGYPVTFLIMFLAAFITSTLAVRLKNHAKQSAQAAYRTKLLFDTNQLLQQEKEPDRILRATIDQIIKLISRDVILYKADGDTIAAPITFSATNQKVEERFVDKEERKRAEIVYKKSTGTGMNAENSPNVKCIYRPICVNTVVYGVIGIVVDGQPLDAFTNSIMTSILGECALTLENVKNAQEKEEAKLLAQNEQLRANLLRAISHDLRTPLTSISGHASNLLLNGEEFDSNTKVQMYEDIYEDSMWLISLVENLLSVTRIEEGKMTLHIVPELMGEIIEEALLHVNNKRSGHRIEVDNQDEFVFVKADAKLLVQVIINIVDNAIKYSPEGSNIQIATRKQEDMLIVSVSDYGSGIPDDIKTKVFEMFYSGANKIADSRRSLGLGLYLCKSIVSAHGGEIWVSDNCPCGATFSFSLPIEEVHLHE